MGGIQDTHSLKEAPFSLYRLRENGCIWDFSGQEKPPNRNNRQPENRSKTDGEAFYDSHRWKLSSFHVNRVIRKLKEFEFKTDLNWLPEHMSWDVETVREVTVSIGR